MTLSRIFRWLIILEKHETLVRVVSWRPYWDSRFRCIGWPTITVDSRFRGRYVKSPLWSRERFIDLLKGPK